MPVAATAHSTPERRPYSAAARAIADANAESGVDSSVGDLYTMARSMRLGVSTLSPHSLDSGVDLGESCCGAAGTGRPGWVGGGVRSARHSLDSGLGPG
jgi:hypothetical protein